MRARLLVFAAVTLVAGLVLAIAVKWGAVKEGSKDGAPAAGPGATYIGGQACASCHEVEHSRWMGSHHDLAMQVADEGTVLGEFKKTTFTHGGVTSTFDKKDGKFYVRTDGPDGDLRDYEITYTFGVEPLQQYVIEVSGGRYQALGIAWDSRPKQEGGQRWFHLYPEERIPHDDPLHWTGRNQNWNYMCAACHSTNLEKNYDLEHDTYETTWSDIDVSCESCHGPGSEHVKWAKSKDRDGDSKDEMRYGLLVDLKPQDTNVWKLDPQKGTAMRETPLESHAELETCAHCHSRRRTIHESPVPGGPLLDTHQPSLLEPHLYEPDGQIMGEVYVYGSFLQSKMYRAGVTCSDCHEPHSLTLRKAGNALCTRCHLPEKFDTPKHHFHDAGSTGAQCVSCHMPAKTYMVVDPRHDHSFRVPRPDLSVKLGTPNACTQCHQDKSAQWAVRAIGSWHGARVEAVPHYGEVLQAGRHRNPNAGAALGSLVADTRVPGIVRGTALTLMRPYPGQTTLDAIRTGLQDNDPLVRIGAIRAVHMIKPAARLDFVGPLLDDPIRAVRIEAARLLAPVPSSSLDDAQRAELEKAAAEYIAAELTSAERPSAHLNLGIFYTDRGEPEKAESAYRTALRLDPSFYPALVNLADLYRLQRRDEEGEKWLRQALKIAPDDAQVHHSLGLLLARLNRQEEALASLQRAVDLQPENSRHSYVYGIALNSLGKADAAIEILERVHERHPNHREILVALVTINRDHGKRDAAIVYAEKLLVLSPQDQAAKQLLEEMRSGPEK